MKKMILGLIIALMITPNVSLAMTQEQKLEVTQLIEILLKRVLELQDQLIALREAELEAKKEELRTLKTINNEVEMAKEKTYKVISPEDGKVQVNESMTVEEMRAFVISLNRDHIKFRKQMETATAKELVEFLKNNGYSVK